MRWTEAIEEEILERVSSERLDDILNRADMPTRQTVMRRLSEDEAFARKYFAAHAAHGFRLLEQAEQEATAMDPAAEGFFDGSSLDFKNELAARKFRAEMFFKLAEKWAPRFFSPKSTVLTEDDGKPAPIGVVVLPPKNGA